MKKTFTIILGLLTIAFLQNINAQHPVIAVQNGDNPEFFTNLDEAIDAAKDGDTLYLPGGNFQKSNEVVMKEIHLIGVGHYPDTVAAAGRTAINGTFYLGNGTDSSSFEGIYLSGGILLQNESNKMVETSYITIKRCNIGDLDLGGYFNYGTEVTANDVSVISVIENVIRGSLVQDAAKECIFEKNIFNNAISTFSAASTFKHNIFLKQTGVFSANIDNANFENNIFMLNGDDIFYRARNNSFYNNLFVDTDFNIESKYANEMVDNIGNVDAETIFVNKTKDVFDYDQDYTLATDSPAEGIGVGGKDLGIYGHEQPFTNGITSYPFVHEITIPNTTDTSGNLNIQVKVSAQDY